MQGSDWLVSVRFAENALADWVFALALGVAVFLALRLAVTVLTRHLDRLSRKTGNTADDLMVAALKGTRHWLLALVAVWAGARLLELGAAQVYADRLLFFAVALQAALWLNRAVSAYIEFYTLAKKETDPGAISAVQGLSYVARVFIWSVALLLVIDNLGYDVTALVAGLGIGGVAIALAVQNILGDLFASLSIVLDKPFVIGDFLIVGDLLGSVEKIGLKTTRVRSLSGEQLIFANSDLLNSRIRNFKRMYERRVPFTFGVVYQTTPEQLEAIPKMVREIIEGMENVRFDRAHFKGFGESAYDFEVVYYVGSPDYNVYMDIQQAINLAICRGFRDRGIEFAYPTRTLYLHSGDGSTPVGAGGERPS